MKLIILFSASLFLINISINAQQGWFWQNPLPKGNFLSDIYEFDENTAIDLGEDEVILRTTDGGTNWNPQTSGTTQDLHSVHFADNNAGWAVGLEGTILKTTDGGMSWNSKTSGTTE